MTKAAERKTGRKKPPADKPVPPRVLALKAQADRISTALGGLRLDVNDYAEDATGSPEHTAALTAAHKQCEKAEKDVGDIVMCLLAAHGAAEIQPPTEQMGLMPKSGGADHQGTKDAKED